VALEEDLEQELGPEGHLEVGHQVIVDVRNNPLCHHWLVDGLGDVQCNQQVVADLHVDLLLLDLQLVGVRSLLSLGLYDLGDTGEDQERLGELLGFNGRDERKVAAVETESQDRIDARIQKGVLEVVFLDELRAECLCRLFRNHVVAQLVGDLREVPIKLVQG